MSREMVTIPTGTYAVRPASSAFARHSWAAERLAAWCGTDLHIGRVRIAWYLDPQAASPAAERKPLRGYVNDDQVDLVYVRADQTELETLRSVAHESWHLFELANGHPLDEGRAEAYGRRAAADYIARRIP